MSGGAFIPIPAKHEVLSVADLQKLGSAKLPKVAEEFFNSGSTDQQTIRENSSAFNKYRLRSRCLVDVSNLETSTTVFGRQIAFPLCLSPAGIQAMAHPDGELATSRAAARKGVNMAISSFANYEIDEIVKQGGGNVTYAIQLYTYRDRGLEERIIRKAEAAGVKAIFLTADSPVLGVRYNEWKNDFRTPEGLGFPILEYSTERIRQQTHDDGFMKFNDSSHNWERDIAWLRSKTKMQIWIKGIVTAEDVELAIKHGCDGVVVSNHGGRQLDGVPATIDALVECVEAAQGKIPVHVDGGFRRGQDIFIALALGADCCWVGRPVLWGLAYDGQAGVDKMLDIMYDEFRRTMALCGCNSIQDIRKSCLARIDADGMLKRLS